MKRFQNHVMSLLFVIPAKAPNPAIFSLCPMSSFRVNIPTIVIAEQQLNRAISILCVVRPRWLFLVKIEFSLLPQRPPRQTPSLPSHFDIRYSLFGIRYSSLCAFVLKFFRNFLPHKFGVGILTGEKFKLRAGLVNKHR